MLHYKVRVFYIVLLFKFIKTDYWEERGKIIEAERHVAVGGNVALTEKETMVNNILLKLKKEELKSGSNYFLNKNFLKIKNEVDKSKVLDFIRGVPKGGCLHTHLTASSSFDFLWNNITYRDNLYVCQNNDKLKLRFYFNNSIPDSCILVDEARKNVQNFDHTLKRVLTIDSETTKNFDSDQIWEHFKSIFSAIFEMLSYRPAFEAYVFNSLEELYLDKIFYVEFRGTIMPLYDSNGTVYGPLEFIQFFSNTVANFRKDHPNFVGAKFIYSCYRNVTKEVMEANFEVFSKIKSGYPNFVAGFDLVGHEDGTRPLSDYAEVFYKRKQVKYFFHAGETNWYGNTDLNLIDAIILNTTRLGHGIGLYKHPELLKLTKERNIAIELSPISNQILGFVSDFRNHPGSYLISQGFPIVIGNDDPGVWGTHGVSYDWYMVFMAMTHESAGLEVLKTLAINSLEYSAMGVEEKITALSKWEEYWREFLDTTIINYA